MVAAAKTAKKASAQKVDVATFVVAAIEALRKPPYPGIHVVWSHFNEAFRAYFPDLDPIAEVDKLVVDGLITKSPTKGGVIIYIAAEPRVMPAKATKPTVADTTLAKILG
jgi:hypothetical protein